MTSRYIKLLSASTAFVAAATATSAHAGTMTVTSNTTAPLYTSDTTGILNISGTATISTTGTPAIEVSNSGTATVNISTSAVVRSTAVTGTIAISSSSVTGATINNSGSIINLGGAAAISNISSTGTLTVNNVGTISGTIDNGSGALTYTGTNGIQRGNISSANTAGTDAVTLTGGSMVGNVGLSNGVNAFTVSNSTFTGNYTGGTGVDTVNVKDSSTYTGNITLGTGSDVLNVSNSTIVGDITSGAAALATITLTNATVSGTITDAAAGDSDVLNINGQNTFTTHGNIGGYENVNINTSTVLNHALAGTDAIAIASGKTLTVNNSFATGTTGTVTNAGTLRIDAGKTVTMGGYTGTGGTLGLVLVSSNTTSGIGKVAFSNGATITAAPSLTVILSNTSYIASGTTYTIVDGNGGSAAAATILNSNTGVYRFSSVANGNNIDLTVGRVSTSSVVNGSDNDAVANTLDILGSGATGTLATVQGVVGNQSTAAGVEDVLESLTPSIDGAGMAALSVAIDTGNQVSNRLASLRTTGVATGDAMANKHMWAQAFGSTVDQDNKDGQSGYDANSGGLSIGVDTDTLVEGTTTGMAISYGHGSVDSKGAGNATTDIDSYLATLYGSRVLDNGMFVNGQAGAGYNSYEMDRTIIGVGKASGDTNGWQGNVKVEGGKDFAAGGFTLTPLASLQYTYLDMDSYTETGAGGASLRVNPESLSALDAAAGVNAAYGIALTDGGTLKPNAHVKYIYRMGDTSMGTTSQFTGGGAAFNTSGVKSDRSSINLGAGLLLTTVAGTDLSLNYDADIRSNLVGHTGQLKARWAF